MTSISEDHDEGTTVAYVFALILPITFTLLLNIFLNLHTRSAGTLRRFFTDFIVIVYIGVFNVTVLSDYIVEVLAVLILLTVPLVLVHLWKWIVSRDMERGTFAELGANVMLRMTQAKAGSVMIPAKQVGYVTMLRATILLLTVICILAVDFNIFPGYSFKTHEYGCSLMDVGIGLFVCSIAMVSNKPPVGHFASVKNLARLVWNISPLIVLGVGRAVVIKQIDYNQGVTEYGAHWNAFLTLGFTRFFSALFASFVPRTKHLTILAFVILVAHEAALECGVAEYVMSKKTLRDNLFRANREGVVSIPGFVALELLTMFIGRLLRSTADFMSVQDLLKKIRIFVVLSASLWVVLFQIDALIGISRRVCNAGYVLWILTLLVTMSTLFMFIELFAAIMFQHKTKDRSHKYIPLIMQSINHNGLLFFLLANVLTGMVNMNINTQKVDTLHSLAILLAYMLVNCAVVVLLYVKMLRIKFW